MSKRTQRHIKTKEAILEAARQIVMESGPDALSMRTLAKRIEYSPAGLYEYFPSKEAIVGELIMMGHELLYAYMAKVPLELPTAEYMVEIGLSYIEFAVTNPDYFLLMFSSYTLSAAEFEQMSCEASAFKLLLDGIQRGVAQGAMNQPPHLSLFDIAYGHWGIVHGLAMLRVTHMRALTFNFAAADRATLEAFQQGWAT